jgi:hypothetical protein
MLKTTLAITATLATLALANPAIAAPADFIGTWVNTDSNTRGITKVIIQPAGSNKLTIQTFGKCSPTDCTWGKVALPSYGTNVSDSDHKAATATYNQGFSQSLLTLQLAGATNMSLNSYTLFTDNSNRQPYFSLNRFKKI